MNIVDPQLLYAAGARIRQPVQTPLSGLDLVQSQLPPPHAVPVSPVSLEAAAPPVTVVVSSPLRDFCCSRIGIAVLSSVLFFVVLFVLRPSFVMHERDVDKDGFQLRPAEFNAGSALAVSLAGAAVVFFVPQMLLNNVE